MSKDWAEQEAEKLRGKICCCNDPQSDEAIAQALRVAHANGCTETVRHSPMFEEGVEAAKRDFIASGEVQKMEWLAFVRGFEAGKSAALKVLRGHCATENCDEYDFCTDRAVMRTAIKALTPEGK